MTEPTPLDKAELSVREAETNTVAIQLALAAVELAKAATSQREATGCQHQHPAPKTFETKKWVVIGGTVCVCSIAFALASIAIAIGGVALTICVLVLRGMYEDYRKGR
jgi:hypothetical protein